MKTPVVSILICTANRAAHLRATLEAVAKVRVPEDLPAELIVIDNASSDDTAEAVRSFACAHLPVRYVREDRRGKGYAYNTGVSAARGRVLLFTDDDVHPPIAWIEGMCRPIAEGACDGVAGCVRIAPHLLRPWMGRFHRISFASTEHLAEATGEAAGIVGANMAFGRQVFDRGLRFDPELGPGALGLCDEVLLYLQAREAGFRIRYAGDVAVEHHFDASRLSSESLRGIARRQGNSHAYVLHHWEHQAIPHPRRKLVTAKLRLAGWRLRRRAETRAFPPGEGIPEWEMQLLADVHTYEQYLIERRRPRNYARHGLVKLTEHPSPAPSQLAPATL